MHCTGTVQSPSPSRWHTVSGSRLRIVSSISFVTETSASSPPSTTSNSQRPITSPGRNEIQPNCVSPASLHQPPIMKPVVSAMHAWSCTVISVFAIIILSVLGSLYRSGHEEFVGGKDDPKDGKAVSGTVFTAVIVYAAFLVFCGFQGLLHVRENRRGAIAL
ncbi:hypothetical protein G6O67_001639 [Ophiocordyceps sinensis]|uniref:KLTH0A01078p-like protein n=1 Tax=Ophiocordyceps sinensis TaxID=72228 RepID=A0A8H4V947_9HYPO|nr:hypothetical protein G6O67_001639 [Ophiocordyceps sinensis]